jgi:dTDP-4-dehydrorhamnose reductase
VKTDISRCGFIADHDRTCPAAGRFGRGGTLRWVERRLCLVTSPGDRGAGEPIGPAVRPERGCTAVRGTEFGDAGGDVAGPRRPAAVEPSELSRLAVLVTGGHGQLGSELVGAALAGRAGLVDGPGSAELDITDAGQTADAVAAFAGAARDAGLRPVLINAAAYTAVDAAETDEQTAALVNATAPGLLAAACAAHGTALLHVSTDYVFAGDGERPYLATDPTEPRTAYGRTKLAGERAVLASGAQAHVVRTAWVYGAGGANFVRTMARLAAERDTVSVVDDQRGSPTWTADLADGLLALAAVAHRLPRGVLHCTNAGETTWYGFARAVFEQLGADPARVHPCTTADFPRPAPRPAYSVLSATEWTTAGLPPRRPWRAALTAAFHRDAPTLTQPLKSPP